MPTKPTSIIAQKGEYNFAIQGGAVSTILLGCVVPFKCYMSEIQVGIITSLGSGGAATIDFGYDAIGNAAASSNNAFTSGGAIAFTAFVSTGQGGYKISTTQFNSTFAFELTMTINAAALTGGRMVIVPVFTRMDY